MNRRFDYPIQLEDKTTYNGEVHRERGGWAIGAAMYEPLEKTLAECDGYVIELEIKLIRKGR
jgi:hypothetical protein